MAHNVGRNEGNLGTVRAVNNPKPLRVDFLDDSYHFVGAPLSLQRLPAHLFEQGTSLFVVLSRSLPPVACFLVTFSVRIYSSELPIFLQFDMAHALSTHQREAP
jgi:hypothetical protein